MQRNTHNVKELFFGVGKAGFEPALSVFAESGYGLPDYLGLLVYFPELAPLAGRLRLSCFIFREYGVYENCKSLNLLFDAVIPICIFQIEFAIEITVFP